MESASARSRLFTRSPREHDLLSYGGRGRDLRWRQAGGIVVVQLRGDRRAEGAVIVGAGRLVAVAAAARRGNRHRMPRLPAPIPAKAQRCAQLARLRLLLLLLLL